MSGIVQGPWQSGHREPQLPLPMVRRSRTVPPAPPLERYGVPIAMGVALVALALLLRCGLRLP